MTLARWLLVCGVLLSIAATSTGDRITARYNSQIDVVDGSIVASQRAIADIERHARVAAQDLQLGRVISADALIAWQTAIVSQRLATHLRGDVMMLEHHLLLPAKSLHLGATTADRGRRAIIEGYAYPNSLVESVQDETAVAEQAFKGVATDLVCNMFANALKEAAIAATDRKLMGETDAERVARCGKGDKDSIGEQELLKSNLTDPVEASLAAADKSVQQQREFIAAQDKKRTDLKRAAEQTRFYAFLFQLLGILIAFATEWRKGTNYDKTATTK